METNDVFNFSNHREYLRGYLASGRRSSSLRALARRAGFKSPGHLSLIIQGERRLTSRSAALLAKALNLKGRRRTLFLAFSRLDSSQTEAERDTAREEILKLRSTSEEVCLNAKQYSFLAVWYYPVIYVMIESKPGTVNSVDLAKHLGRGVTVSQVDQAIEDLLDLKLLERSGTGGLRAKDTAISTPPELRDLAAAQYHRNSLRLAIEAMDLPLNEREFGGLTVAIPKKMMPVVKEKIRALRSELNELLAQESEPADVFQLNMQLFPLTKNIEGMPS